MTKASEYLDRIEAILANIEKLDAETGGQYPAGFRQARLLTATRIETKDAR